MSTSLALADTQTPVVPQEPKVTADLVIEVQRSETALRSARHGVLAARKALDEQAIELKKFEADIESTQDVTEKEKSKKTFALHVLNFKTQQAQQEALEKMLQLAETVYTDIIKKLVDGHYRLNNLETTVATLDERVKKLDERLSFGIDEFPRGSSKQLPKTI